MTGLISLLRIIGVSVHSQDPFTHIYMFDLGFPPPLQKSIAHKFNNRCTPMCSNHLSVLVFISLSLVYLR